MQKYRWWFAAAAMLIVGLTAFGVRCWNWHQVFVLDQVYFVDADCYSRMTRVVEVLQHPFQPIKFHAFENAPLGIKPHTTAPMDWTIALLATALKPWTTQSIDFAGAFVSPLLGAILAIFLTWWVFLLRVPAKIPFLAVLCLSPILAHGFLLGRPDHQSLLLLLIGVAWAAEGALWRGGGRTWQVVSAVSWALALWTSLFEPLILIIATGLARGFILGRRGLPDRRSAIVFFAILAIGLIFDGWRASALPVDAAIFFRWGKTIGELHPATFAQMLGWTGWLLALAPVLLLYRGIREKDRVSLTLTAFLLLLVGLCLWHARWGYFLALGFAFTLPVALPVLRWRLLMAFLFFVSLWPMAKEWDGDLFPDAERQAAQLDERKDHYFLREAATALISDDKDIVLAPWWLSPSLNYWSGQPCVAGSSHQSLPGTVATAHFYLATDPAEARRILRERNVRYVVAYEPSRILENSAEILGVSVPTGALGEILYHQPARAPQFLRPVYENEYFKIYATQGL